MTERMIALVRTYTGWHREMAINAISQWRLHNPDWDGEYIAAYVSLAP